MATQYTSLLGLALPVTGELSGTWGDVVNNSITQLVEDSVANYATASVTSGDWTLSTTGSGAANEARMMILRVTGSPGVSRNVIAPSKSKIYVVMNGSDAAIVLKGSATTGVTIASGKYALCGWNGTDFTMISGDVVGPSSATGNALAVFDGTTGRLLKNGPAPGTLGNVLQSDGTNWTSTAYTPALNSPLAVVGNSTEGASIRLPEDTDNGSSYLALKAPDALAGNITLTFPTTAGSAGQALVTDGSGILSWSAAGGFSSVSVISGNTTAAKSTLYVMTASLNLTLPASPSTGDMVGVSNRSGTTTCVVLRNSTNIMGLAQDMTVDVVDAGFTLIYSGATQGWVII